MRFTGPRNHPPPSNESEREADRETTPRCLPNKIKNVVGAETKPKIQKAEETHEIHKNTRINQKKSCASVCFFDIVRVLKEY